ncbi:MAG: acyl dehydratase [Gemmatimonas sp. SG8_23]|nr:MAG: acyl dehydratase [Gemmatimonas sp. SG8_23]
MAGNPKIGCDAISVGDSQEELLVENLTRTQIVQYAGASGDFNPIHHDEMFATKAAGYPSVFAHGMLTMGMTGRLLTNWLGDGVLREYGVRFVNQVWPGDTLTAKGTVESIEKQGDEGLVHIAIVTTNQKGEPVVKGSAVAALPSRL